MRSDEHLMPVHDADSSGVYKSMLDRWWIVRLPVDSNRFNLQVIEWCRAHYPNQWMPGATCSGIWWEVWLDDYSTAVDVYLRFA